jgi:hypothetical protein
LGQTIDILAAILTCSLYADDALVRAIVDNAHDNPLVIFTPERDHETGALSTAPETLERAVTHLRDVVANGGRPLVGLMQVPVTWASTFGREATDLFDPCINVSIGSAILSEFDYVCGRPKQTNGVHNRSASRASRRTCAVQCYAQAVRMPDLASVVMLNLRSQRAPLASPAEAPIFHAPPDRLWGSDRMLLGPASSGARSEPIPRRSGDLPGAIPRLRPTLSSRE